MPDSSAPNALLFDLGGVLIDIDFDRVFDHWARFSPLSRDEMYGRSVLDTTYQRYERGEIDDAAFFDHVRRRLELDTDDAEILRGWNAVFVGQNEHVLDMVRAVSERLPSYAFTNTSASHQRAWTSAFPDVVQSFRRIFSSAEMGMRKPDLEAFEAVTQAIGHDPSTILFFDDLPANVTGAHAAGLQAVHVRGPDDVRAALHGAGLLPAYNLV